LTAQERSDHIAEWIRLVEEKQERENQVRQLGASESDVGYKKPPEQVERGTRAASRELGISETQARRAKLIASIPDEVKQSAAARRADWRSMRRRWGRTKRPFGNIAMLGRSRKR
jgi:hypothetical protein